MAQLKIISCNVRGLNSAAKRSLVFQYLQGAAPHISILLETYLTGSRILALWRSWVGAAYHSTYSCYARGVSVLVKKSLPFQLLEMRTDPGGRYVVLHVCIHDKRLVLIGVYLPPPARIQLLIDLMGVILAYDTPEFYIFGDFNMVSSHDLDKLHSTGRTTSDLPQWAEMYQLTDVWRHLHPHTREYTCHSAS